MEDLKTEEMKQQVKPVATNQDSSFDRKRHIVGAILGPLCAFLVWITPIEALTPEAHHLLAIISFV